MNGRQIRRHQRRSDDGKGLRRLIAGKRFRLPAGVSSKEADQRFLLIERIWPDNESFCRRIGCEPRWTDTALWAAQHIGKGTLRIPLPPIDDILASYGDAPWPHSLHLVLDPRTDETLRCRYPAIVDGLAADEAMMIFDLVSDAFPSVNWSLPVAHANYVVDFHERQARYSLLKLSQARSQSPPDPATPLVAGTLHEALFAYEQMREEYFTRPDETFDGSGHHMIGIRCRRGESVTAPITDSRSCRAEAY